MRSISVLTASVLALLVPTAGLSAQELHGEGTAGTGKRVPRI